MGIFDSIFGGKKNDKEAEKKSIINNSNELPEWFDGEVYEEGDNVLNPFTGEKIMLTANELSMYDYVQGCSMLSSNLLNDSIIKNWQNGLSWFKSANPEAFGVLLGGLNPNKTNEDLAKPSNEIKSDEKSKIKIIENDNDIDFQKYLLSEFKENIGEDSEYYHLSFAVFLSEQNFFKEGTGEPDDELVFKGYELVVSARWWNEEDEYEEGYVDEEVHIELFTAGKNKDSGEIYFIANHPDGYSEGVDEDEHLIEGDIEKVSEFLSKIKTIDYESLSSSDKKNFVEIITN